VTSNGGATPEVNSRMKAKKIENRRNRLVEDSSLGANSGAVLLYEQVLYTKH
jgi:hypothetical protein